jgi:hypothetical protein
MLLLKGYFAAAGRIGVFANIQGCDCDFGREGVGLVVPEEVGEGSR